MWEREEAAWQETALWWSLGALLLSTTAALTGMAVFGRVNALYRVYDARVTTV